VTFERLLSKATRFLFDNDPHGRRLVVASRSALALLLLGTLATAVLAVRSREAEDRVRHTLDVRFYERGAGETMSSGTGSTGAVAAALSLGLVEPPVTVETPAGPLYFRVEGGFYLTGPAVLIGSGEFYL